VCVPALGRGCLAAFAREARKRQERLLGASVGALYWTCFVSIKFCE
jgi:hypothetical protein